MGKFPASDHAPDPLAHVRQRALEDTAVAFVITDGSSPRGPIVWVNAAFERATGYSFEEVVGRNPNLLNGEGTAVEAVEALRDLILFETAGTVTLLNYRKGGEPFWNQVSVSPLRDDDGSITHWVGVQVDVTDQVDRLAARAREVEAERRARTSLAVIAQVSDLVMDLDDPAALREIGRVMERNAVAWAGFFLTDVGLRAVPGSEADLPRVGRPRRSGAPAPEAAVPTAGASSTGAASGDAVLAVLDGTDEGPVYLDTDEVYPEGTVSRAVIESLVSGSRSVLDAPDASTRVVVLPLLGRRRVLGLLVAVLGTAAKTSVGDGRDVITVLELTARRVGLALDVIRLYAREHRLAETLQRAMLPEQAEIADLDVWTYYAPNSGHAQVGGDWYDVLQITDEVVSVVIGDVVGHDVEAAAAMGQLRSVVRSYAFEVSAPGPVLERVDRLVAGMGIPRSASLVLATLVRSDTGWRMDYSRAGHLPPLLVRRGTVTELDEAGGSLIGFGRGARENGHAELSPGDVLVFYTDGLIERRDRPLRQGLDALVEVCRRVTTTDAAGIGEELLSRLAEAPEDDVAVVVVRVPDREADDAEAGHSPRRRRWLLPSEPASIARARHAVVRTARTWHIAGATNAELVVSEMVANAVMHGWGHVTLRLFDTGDGLRIEVEDANPAPPVRLDGHPGRVGGYGMQIVERLADWGWRPSGSGKLVWAKVRLVDDEAEEAEQAGQA